MLSMNDYMQISEYLNDSVNHLNNHEDADLEKLTFNYLLNDTGDHGCAASGFFGKLDKEAVLKYLNYVAGALEEKLGIASRKDDSSDCVEAQKILYAPRVIQNIFAAAEHNKWVRDSKLELGLYERLNNILKIFNKWFVKFRFSDCDKYYVDMAKVNYSILLKEYENRISHLKTSTE